MSSESPLCSDSWLGKYFHRCIGFHQLSSRLTGSAAGMILPLPFVIGSPLHLHKGQYSCTGVTNKVKAHLISYSMSVLSFNSTNSHTQSYTILNNLLQCHITHLKCTRLNQVQNCLPMFLFTMHLFVLTQNNASSWSKTQVLLCQTKFNLMNLNNLSFTITAIHDHCKNLILHPYTNLHRTTQKVQHSLIHGSLQSNAVRSFQRQQGLFLFPGHDCSWWLLVIDSWMFGFCSWHGGFTIGMAFVRWVEKGGKFTHTEICSVKTH